MVKSAIDRVEQAHLIELFGALRAVVGKDPQLAEPVIFWRHQLLVGVEPSQLPELVDVLSAIAAAPVADSELWERARHWHAILESRAQRAEPWQAH